MMTMMMEMKPKIGRPPQKGMSRVNEGKSLMMRRMMEITPAMKESPPNAG